MPDPIKLHPKVRERQNARIAAQSLAEFIIATPDKQDTILHDQRYSSAYMTAKYTEALNAIRAFCLSSARDKAILRNSEAALLEKSTSPAFTPKQREQGIVYGSVLHVCRLANYVLWGFTFVGAFDT